MIKVIKEQKKYGDPAYRVFTLTHRYTMEKEYFESIRAVLDTLISRGQDVNVLSLKNMLSMCRAQEREVRYKDYLLNTEIVENKNIEWI